MSSSSPFLRRNVGFVVPATSRVEADGVRRYQSTDFYDSDDSYTDYTTRVPPDMLLGRRRAAAARSGNLTDTELFCSMYRDGFKTGAESQGRDESLIAVMEERKRDNKVTDKWFVEGFYDGYRFIHDNQNPLPNARARNAPQLLDERRPQTLRLTNGTANNQPRHNDNVVRKLAQIMASTVAPER